MPETNLKFDHRRVIIANFVFRYSTKEPYVRSGESLLGAIELDGRGRMKCHECGAFQSCLAEHLASHRVTCSDYRTKHGLSQFSKLRLNKDRKKQVPNLGKITEPAINISANTRAPKNPEHLHTPEAAAKAVARRLAKGGINPQLRNLRNLCAEQIKARVYALAIKLGRMPLTEDLKKIRIYSQDARRLIGEEGWLRLLDQCSMVHLEKAS